jgi:hypothetical protein
MKVKENNSITITLEHEEAGIIAYALENILNDKNYFLNGNSLVILDDFNSLLGDYLAAH